MSYSRETAATSTSPLTTSPKKQPRPLRNLLPSPHFEQTRLGTIANEEAIEASVLVDEPAVGFQPFFTLIENPLTSEHYHPTVHYIFADDDAEIITEAACRALAQDDAQHGASQGEEETKLPAPVGGVREHYILLDVRPDGAGSGYDVTKAHSLSAEWQVTNATISNAPTIDGTDSGSAEGLMLKIEGIGAIPRTGSDEAGKKEGLQQLVERFEKGLSEIRKIVDEGQPDLGSAKHQFL